MQERRSSKRLDIDVTIELKGLNTDATIEQTKEIAVEVTDISRNGMGFISSKILQKSTFYDVKLQLWTKEILPLVIDIVRLEKISDDMYHYGASFIGMMESEALKIDIYDMVHEKEQS